MARLPRPRLRDTSGRIAGTAVVIEPATASEVAWIAVRAHEFSMRECQITQLLAHG